jgi:hypothetical protein
LLREVKAPNDKCCCDNRKDRTAFGQQISWQRPGAKPLQ